MSVENKFDKRGKPRKLETVDDYRRALRAYHAAQEAMNDGEGVIPDLAGFAVYIGMRKRDLIALSQGEDEFAMGLRDVLEESKDMRESWLVRKMTSDNKRAIGCMNALKQQDNGGYIDKPVDSGERTLTINVAGIKGGANAFK